MIAINAKMYGSQGSHFLGVLVPALIILVMSLPVSVNQVSNRPPTWYKPGQSGNPKGRPKGSGSIKLGPLLDRALSRNDGEEAERVIKAIVDRAAQGDPAMVRELLQRTDGAVTQKIITQVQGDELVTRFLDAAWQRLHEDPDALISRHDAALVLQSAALEVIGQVKAENGE